MNKMKLALAVLTLPLLGNAAMLGTFTFNDNQFGNTLLESDGGTFSASNWLNTVNSNPGNPAYLTGANFDTGIANIGLGASPLYTIGYSTAILNGAGDDLGIVSARYSVSDTFTLEVSTDGGGTFSAPVAFGPGLAVSTGVATSYFYGGGGPFGASLFVTPVDLSAFGLAGGAAVNAIRITGGPEADLIRVAGFGDSAVPEPGTMALLGLGLGAIVFARKRQ